MEEDKCQTPDCPECKKREVEFQKSEELGLAVLVALMPLMTITLLSNVGLF